MTLFALIVASWMVVSVVTAVAFSAVVAAVGRTDACVRLPPTGATATQAVRSPQPVRLPAQRRSSAVPSPVG